MALPTRLPFGYRIYTAEMTDVSTSSSTYIPVAGRGKVTAIYCVLHGTVTGTSAMTFSINATAITGATIADVGTSAGTVSSCVPTALNRCYAGDYLKATTDGNSTNTVRLTISFVVREF